MITVEHLTKYYGRHLAVNDISFTINDNEILGFLGPNGAGKSTTMNMITGYLPMTKGTVNICGEDISKNPVKAKKNIGYLPEIPPVYPDMKVNEYLKFCAELKKIPASQRKEQIESAVNRLRLQEVSKRLIKNLSKGYKQRVGFAQALLGNPKFLILDEPTVGLDPEQVAEVRNIFEAKYIAYQISELGRVDLGGGGTIAYILADKGVDVIDCGVGGLSMHAPYEVTSKFDIYTAYEAYKTFFEKMQ